MIFRDQSGIELKPGTPVMFPLALGQTTLAEVVATSAGLAPGSVPQVTITISLNLPALPNGTVPGIHVVSLAPSIQP